MKTVWMLAFVFAHLHYIAHAATNCETASLYWPQWRGPLAAGVSPSADPPLHWNESSNILWKVRLPGCGTSTPIVWGDRVFIQSAAPVLTKTNNQALASNNAGKTPPVVVQADSAYQFLLLALDRQTGKLIWQRIVREEVPHEGHHRDQNFACYSPITDGRHVYAYFGSWGLYCYDFDGTLKWSRDLGRMKIWDSYGEGGSIALAEGILAVKWDHEGDDFIAAFDTQTGRELWRQPRDEDTSWSAPIMVPHNGRCQVVTDATRRLCGYDLKTGRLLWEHARFAINVVNTPVAGDGLVYSVSGLRTNAVLALDLNKESSGEASLAWRHSGKASYVPSPLLYDERLYYFAGNTPMLNCLNVRNGQMVFEMQKVDGIREVYSSITGAAGKVYLVGRNGVTVVIENADRYVVLAVNRLDEGFDASPALAGNQLFLRSKEFLYCIQTLPGGG